MARLRVSEKSVQVAYNELLRVGRVSLLIRFSGKGADAALNGDIVTHERLYVNGNMEVSVRMKGRGTCADDRSSPREVRPQKGDEICTLRSEDAAVCLASR